MMVGIWIEREEVTVNSSIRERLAGLQFLASRMSYITGSRTVMSWNHRVIRQKTGLGRAPEFIYSVHEVCYDDEGEIQSWRVEPVSPSGEDLKELRSDISLFGAALERPVLEELGFDGKPKLVEIKGGCS